LPETRSDHYMYYLTLRTSDTESVEKMRA
jgi:hypothetical protein